MISITEALTIIKNNIPPPDTEECSLLEALDRYLTADIHATEASPRYTGSAMDGYAVRWQDVSRATPTSPVTLVVTGESRAGVPFYGSIQQGQAIRISTGAMLPDDADTVIRVEETTENENRVTVLSVHKNGQDIRFQGEEFPQGALLLHQGTRISAPQIALLAAVGIETVKVFKPCEVALLVTGDEFAAAGQMIEKHQIRDSNMAMLVAAVRESGGTVVNHQKISDDKAATITAIDQERAKIILCSGGVSVGRHDHVKEAAEANGFTPLFWKIRQKPGKPLFFARKDNQLLFGLPGNPVSAFMCFTHYVRPIIATLAGQPFGWPTVSAQACGDIENKGTRTTLLRVQVNWRPNDGYCLAHTEKQGSHMLTSLVDADGYIILEPGQVVKNGERTDVYRYDLRREPV